MNALASLIQPADAAEIRQRIARTGRVMRHKCYDFAPERNPNLSPDAEFLEAFEAVPARFSEWDLLDICPLRLKSIRLRLYRLLEQGKVRSVTSPNLDAAVFIKVVH